MIKTIYFDMDGTIANLYAVENWLEDLENENAEPYYMAEPMLDMNKFSIICTTLQKLGIKIGIITWLSKECSNEYKKKIRDAKRWWLKKHCNFKFDETHMIAYGTPKHYVAKDKMGLLIDDEILNCEKWNGVSSNPTIENIMETLINVIMETCK